VDPKTVNEIMSQGATHAETPQERREREQLEADLESSPVRGQPLPQRLRAIEDAVEQHELRLGEAWQALAEEVEDPAEFAAGWRKLAGNWDFATVNDLIERHNRNFPAEARLAMDPRTRDFVRVNGRSYLREPFDAQWILDRFPPDRAAAVAA